MEDSELKEELAWRAGFALIPNRGEPEDGFGLFGKWQWLYPNGTHHKELPDLKTIAKFLLEKVE